jgi:hypothetical protein
MSTDRARRRPSALRELPADPCASESALGLRRAAETEHGENGCLLAISMEIQ